VVQPQVHNAQEGMEAAIEIKLLFMEMIRRSSWP
jgi:hypothetical protein